MSLCLHCHTENCILIISYSSTNKKDDFYSYFYSFFSAPAAVFNVTPDSPTAGNH